MQVLLKDDIIDNINMYNERNICAIINARRLFR